MGKSACWSPTRMYLGLLLFNIFLNYNFLTSLQNWGLQKYADNNTFHTPDKSNSDIMNSNLVCENENL